eukprot:Lithocolla_globosa_v1_NODE_3683_length_1605_cov_14.802708.p3 type:complete len:131 gc:universal NODE_3683_length_1605_cov_14.802708:1531-1139(-)
MRRRLGSVVEGWEWWSATSASMASPVDPISNSAIDSLLTKKRKSTTWPCWEKMSLMSSADREAGMLAICRTGFGALRLAKCLESGVLKRCNSEFEKSWVLREGSSEESEDSGGGRESLMNEWLELRTEME